MKIDDELGEKRVKEHSKAQIEADKRHFLTCIENNSNLYALYRGMAMACDCVVSVLPMKRSFKHLVMSRIYFAGNYELISMAKHI